MIQRVQSIWLLLSAVAAGLSFKFPFYSGNKLDKENIPAFANLTASSNVLILFFTAVLTAGCIAIIFLYKDRKQQLKLTVAALAVSVLNIIIYFTQTAKYVSGNISLTAILPLAIPIFLFFAARGIWKDEKLVKSLDRLR
jgi:hypothetical protein